MTISLEQERRSLLEHIEARRQVYRHMLAGDSADQSNRFGQHRPASQSHSESASGIQNAKAWMKLHPLWLVGGAALLVWLLPRGISSIRQRTHHHAEHRDTQASPSARLKSLAGTALFLLSDPIRMNAIARMVDIGQHWLKQYRSGSSRHSQ